MSDVGIDPWPSDEVLRLLAAHDTATLHEAFDKGGAMTSAIKPIYAGMRLSGVALTVSCRPGDNLSIHAAIEQARPGHVLVVDFGGDMEAGPFGDILATGCEAKGIAGIVIDGCVRDGATLARMGFAAFARGLSMKGTTKSSFGSVGRQILCGGIAVTTGDLVAGDDDGVVVVPSARIVDVLAAAKRRERAEAEMRERLLQGATTMDLLDLRRAMPG